MIYDYECPEHGEFIVERRITESTETVCKVPGCQCKVKQVFTRANVELSFSGSYNNTRNK